MADDAGAKKKAKATKKKGLLDIKNNELGLKVGLIGDSQVGKTSLMVQYVENRFDDDYIQTLGVNFMEKTITLKRREVDITFTIWDLGGQEQYEHMLPLVCNESAALLFSFDLCRKPTLTSVRAWYKKARKHNKRGMAFLIGTKFDLFQTMPAEHRADIFRTARRYSKAMHAPVLFCSSAESINISNIFKIIVTTLFDMRCSIPEVVDADYPVILYRDAVEERKQRAVQAAKERADRRAKKKKAPGDEAGAASPAGAAAGAAAAAADAPDDEEDSAAAAAPIAAAATEAAPAAEKADAAAPEAPSDADDAAAAAVPATTEAAASTPEAEADAAKTDAPAAAAAPAAEADAEPADAAADKEKDGDAA